MTKATKAQIKKLDTIIGRLEALQMEFPDRAGQLAAAKTALMSALRRAENDTGYHV